MTNDSIYIGVKEQTKLDILEFMKHKEPNLDIASIKSYMVKDSDDNYGVIGEHLIIEMVLNTCRIVPGKKVLKKYKYLQKCLISRSEFNSFRKKESGVIFI